MEAIFNIYKACPEAMSILTMFVMAIVVAIVQYCRKQQKWGIILLPLSLLMSVPFCEVWETGKAMQKYPEAVEVFTNHSLQNSLIKANRVWHKPSPEELVRMFQLYQFRNDFHCRIARARTSTRISSLSDGNVLEIDVAGMLRALKKESRQKPDWLYDWKASEELPVWRAI